MTDLQFTTFVPQTSDNERMLLARMLAGMRLKAPVRGTLLASASRTTSTSTSTLDLSGVRCLVLFLSISSVSAGGLRIGVEYLDPVSSTWRASIVAPSAYLAVTGVYPIIVGPGLGTLNNGSMSAGAICSLPLTSSVRLTVQHGDANPQTYSLGYETA